ncbi:thioesterase family protein [Herbaspirillum rhizosphaerae]|uniref:Thioesterase family protein n=1 Tax=Herbaspirillum rhizosphaerae TaxID=346179 RepID=A0ABW8ZBC0_9BURK
MTTKPTASNRADYPHFHVLQTRWMDNDVYGHVNNVVYYSWFDTAVNHFLMEKQALTIPNGDVIGLVIETHCNYFAPVSFPDMVHVGVRVANIGNSSVRYEVGIFRENDVTAAAQGHFIHVYVDAATRRPVKVPDHMRTVLQTILRA